jgi:FkbM family methyltransferase
LWRDLAGLARVVDRRGFTLFLLELARSAKQVVRSGSLRVVDARMQRHGDREYRVSGTRLRLPASSFAAAREMYARGVYFQLEGFHLSEGDFVVDLGANIGLFTLIAARIGAQVIAVEAQSEFLPIARRHLEENGCVERVVLEHALVGSGTGLFSKADQLHGASHFRDAPPPRTLNEILEQHAFPRVDFLKIDIEGSEFDLFAGQTRWLDAVRRIAMEVHPEHGDPATLAGLLRQRGFQVVLRDNDRRTVRRLPDSGGYVFANRRR